MDELEIIKKRIASRRNRSYGTTNESAPAIVNRPIRHKSKRRRNRRPIMTLATAIMFLLSISLGAIMYMRADEQGKFLSYFNINANFTNVNKQVGSVMNNILNFDLFNFDGGSAAVDKTELYQPVVGDLYTTGSNQVKAIDAGTVVSALFINQVATIIIQHDAGFMATYSGMADMLVIKMDRVVSGETIGVSDNNVTIYFSKNSVKLTYEEVCQLLV